MTLVTQTRVREGMAEEFGRWQSAISTAAAEFPGFITQSVLPPNPPLQVDWVIQQRFANVEAASAWLRSERRTRLLDTGQPMLAGQDDVHLVRDSAAGVRPAPVSAVISSRVRPGQEAAFRAWEQRIASCPGQDRLVSRATGSNRRFRACRMTGWRSCASTPSAISRPGSNSPERKKLLEEAAPFLEEFHARVVRTGFEQWFPIGSGRDFGAGGLEAEHDRSAAALSGGVPVRASGCRRRS